jgi:hypothetical protein
MYWAAYWAARRQRQSALGERSLIIRATVFAIGRAEPFKKARRAAFSPHCLKARSF